MQRIIGMIGSKGAGKDTAAAYLVDHFGFRRTAFADALYREVAAAYGVTVAFLGQRDTKETALPELALTNCRDPGFVAVGRQQLTAVYPDLVDLTAPRSPRWTLQLWGTEYRRRSQGGCDSYWLDQVAREVRTRPEDFVITDCRFRNEADFIRNSGGMLVRVRRRVLEAREALDRASGGTAAHPSEVELLHYDVDHEVENVEGQPQLLLAAMAGIVGQAVAA